MHRINVYFNNIYDLISLIGFDYTHNIYTYKYINIYIYIGVGIVLYDYIIMLRCSEKKPRT